MFSLLQYRTLVAVADARSIRKAAEQLGRTPSAISMVISQLEERLGVPLFEGTRKGELTEIGACVLAEARALVELEDRVAREIRSLAQGRAGRLDVACIPSVANVFLPDTLTLLWRERPDVVVHVRDSNSRSVIEMVRSDQSEAGVGTAVDLSDELSFAPLFNDSVAVVCPTGHPLCAVERPLSWEAVLPFRFIGNSSYSLIRGQRLAALLERQAAFIPNITSLLAVVRSGGGVTLLPRINALHSGPGLSFLPLEDPAATRTVGLITRAGRTPSPSASHFADALRTIVVRHSGRYGVTLGAETHPTGGQ